MTTPAPPQTAAALPPPAGLAGAAGLVLALAAGAATGWGAAGLPVERLPDASLRIAAVVTLPLPVLLLGWLTTPQLFGVRAWLGETGPSALASCGRGDGPVRGDGRTLCAGAVGQRGGK